MQAWRRPMAIAVALAATIILFGFSDVDLTAARWFYDPDTGSWLVGTRTTPLLHAILYDGFKNAVIGVAACCAVVVGAAPYSRLLRPWRRRAAFLLVCLVLVPLTVAAAKRITGIHCPHELVPFGGTVPYRHLLEPGPVGIGPSGRCFPAGHASGGFALMALGEVTGRRRLRLAGLTTGLCWGWAMGLYQMARGAHFLSHTIVTMLWAALVIGVLASLVIAPWGSPSGPSANARGR